MKKSGKNLKVRETVNVKTFRAIITDKISHLWRKEREIFLGLK